MYRKGKARASQLTILEDDLVYVYVVVWRRDVSLMKVLYGVGVYRDHLALDWTPVMLHERASREQLR